MMRILEEFWYGNINPVEIPFQRQRQFDKVFKLLTRNEEKLLETLNEQESLRLILSRGFSFSFAIKIWVFPRFCVNSKMII